jgi:thiamine biosynthesis protein ThiI
MMESDSGRRSVLIHYSEIGLKGGNRKFFERIFRENLLRTLSGTAHGGLEWRRGRFVLQLQAQSRREEILRRLARVPGVAYFAEALHVELDNQLGTVTAAALDLCRGEEVNSFRIATRRSVKSFPLSSAEVNARVGSAVVGATGWQVNLGQPDLCCHIELFDRWALVYTSRLEGVRGLPVGTSGKAVSLISAGIDSPVAAYRMICRGCRVFFVHFHSMPYTGQESIEQTVGLVRCLADLQDGAKLHLVPFAEVQQLIIASTPPDLRVILYRRAMLRIAERVARHHRAKCLVTGESLGQVASQTLENIAAIEDAVTLPLLRPLIGHDKESIIREAKSIGTYRLSVEPHDDCCSYLLPKRVETRADIQRVRQTEAVIVDDLENRERAALDSAEQRSIDPPWHSPAPDRGRLDEAEEGGL